MWPTSIFLCQLDSPKIVRVTAMFVLMSPGDHVTLTFGAPPWKILILRYFLDKYIMWK